MVWIGHGASRLLALTGVALLALVACTPTPSSADTPAGVHLSEAIPFCEGGIGHQRDVPRLDLAQPRGAGQTGPVVLLVHGGGWGAGSRLDYRPLMLALAQQGMVAISVDYRLTPAYRFPAQLEDVKCAVRWIRAHAALYRMDTRRLVAVGGSAGAHLVALLGTTAGLAQFEGQGGYAAESSRIDAMVLHGGPYDLVNGIQEAVAAPTAESDHAVHMAESLIGAPLAQRPQAYREASPSSYVSPNSAPALLIHGQLDPKVPHRQAARFHALLQASQVVSDLLVIDGAGHGDFGSKPELVTARFLGFIKGLPQASPAQ